MKPSARMFTYGLLVGGLFGFLFSVLTAFAGPTLLPFLFFPGFGGLVLVTAVIVSAEDAAPA